jgi:2C-methyl-D-erythritol 2,4-cyclodiphosphate synthase
MNNPKLDETNLGELKKTLQETNIKPEEPDQATLLKQVLTSVNKTQYDINIICRIIIIWFVFWLLNLFIGFILAITK